MARANASSQAMADPPPKGWDAKCTTCVSQPGPQVSGRNHWLSGQINLTQEFKCCKTLKGPAMRPTTPHVTENSVGEQSTCLGWVPNDCNGKEHVASAHPPICLFRTSVWKGLFVFYAQNTYTGIHGKILARASVPMFISSTPEF